MTALRTANGWPALDATSKQLETYLVPFTGREPVKLRVHRGSVGFGLIHIAMFYDEDIERLDLSGPRDDWGYAARLIGGTTVITNHNSGTAIDLNATRHPRGVPMLRTYTPAQAKAIRAYLAQPMRKGLFDWGGNWPSHKGSTALPDGMHFEVKPDVTMAQVERYAQRLVKPKNPARRVAAILEANPGLRAVVLS